MPLFSLGPKQSVILSCQLEYKTKKESGSSRHQSATAGIDYENDEDMDKDPTEILFNVNLQTGIDSKELVAMSFENLIMRLRNLQTAIKTKDSKLFYIQLNRYHRYDFVFIGEDHTIGSLIEKWNNRHDPRSVTGYRESRDRKTITVDYGLYKLSPIIFTNNNTGDDDKLEKLIEKSVVSLDEKKEQEQKNTTIKFFLENLERIETYLIELKEDWNKVNIVNVPASEYMEDIENKRIGRIDR